MITCSLGDKKYSVDFVTGRVLREMGPALDMYGRIMKISNAAVKGEEIEDNLNIAEAMDTMVQWFCVLFGSQFTAEDVYDHYPADRLMHDISLALICVQSNATNILNEFPTKAETQQKRTPQKKSTH